MQVFPRMASLRQADVLLSFCSSHSTGGVEWNVCCHTNKQACRNYLWFHPSKHQFLGHADKPHSPHRESRMVQSSVISVLWARQRHFSLRIRQRRQGSLRQAIMCDYTNKSSKNRVSSQRNRFSMKSKLTLLGCISTYYRAWWVRACDMEMNKTEHWSQRYHFGCMTLGEFFLRRKPRLPRLKQERL